VTRAERREILASYPDPAPLRRVYRRLRLARGGYDAVEVLVPREGTVLDLGCGEGLLAQVLARRAPARRVVAVDHDARRVERLRRAVGSLSITAIEGSMTAVPLPPADAILFVDVLHYFDRTTQERLLEKAARALRPGGLLLLREPDAGMRVRMLWNRLHERLFTMLRITKASIGAYRTSGAWVHLLGHAGFVGATPGKRGLFSPYADRVVTAWKAP
jgi:SAM-dependent methyltransferase